MNQFSMGADRSPVDNRTYRHDTTQVSPLTTGGIHYTPEDIEHQHAVGICTAISLTQNVRKATGKKFSADFQYLLQKKFVDLAWYEGSSIFAALKVGKNYGFLPEELFTHVTEKDRYLPYHLYIAKLQAIPDEEVQRLIALCTFKLAGYAQLATDAYSLAKGISDSKAGLICRYEVGSEWWTNPINPLRAPKVIISGHAISKTFFDFTSKAVFELPNTWGKLWADHGKGYTDFANYRCTEAWIPYFDTVPTPLPAKFIFTQDMKQGQTSNDIKELQKRLGVMQTGNYFELTRQAVYLYQLNHVPLSLYEKYILKGKICGSKTRSSLNS